MKEEIGARRHICHIEGITGLSYFIFRLLQSDNNQGKQIAEKMWSDGIRVVVLFGEMMTMELNFTKPQMQVFRNLVASLVPEGVIYDPPLGQFAKFFIELILLCGIRNLKI